MKILYILRHNPWGIGGGCYACRNYLEAFIEVFKNAYIDVLVCEEYLEHRNNSSIQKVNFIGVKPRRTIDRILIPFTKIMHRYQQKATLLLRQNHYDICIFDHNCIAGSLIQLCKEYNVKTIVINHNCEYEYFRDNATGVKKRLLLPVVKHNEKQSYRMCDFNIFLTKEDKDLFLKMYGHSDTKKIVGGCFLNKEEKIEIGNSVPFNPEHIKIVISGTLGNIQNMDGINYFFEELYHYIPNNMAIIITGKNPPEELIEKTKRYSNISIIPNPTDILSIVNQCDIFLCPTRLGGGMKLRVMDGLRCGLPVIVHDISARGYSAFFKEHFFEHFYNTQEFNSSLNKIIERIKNNSISKEEIKKKTMNQVGFKSAIEKLTHANFLQKNI